jgi:hypothetical protein
MAEFKAFDSGVEVQGSVVLSFVHVMGAFKGIALGILKDNGIDDPKPHLWYSQQAWLDSFSTIAQKVGPNTLYQIGRHLPSEGRYPPTIDSIERALEELDVAYKTSHRGGDVGFYRFESTGMRSGKITTFTPYPCEFDRGLIHSLAQHFEPPDSFVDVRHDDSVPCKKLGADFCTHHVSW